MEHRKHFYERYTRAQSRFTSEDQIHERVNAEHSNLALMMDGLLPMRKDTRIVDLGCGYGAFLLMLMKAGYSNLRGVDLSNEQIALAHRLGVHVAEIGTLQHAIADETNVGMITMFDVIEHLTRIEAIEVLQSIYRALSDNGVLVMRTPNIDARLGSALSYGDLTHEMHLNKYSALELFASLEYRSVEILPVFPVSSSRLTKILRSVASPLLNLHSRIEHLVQGVSYSATISTPNMMIIARR